MKELLCLLFFYWIPNSLGENVSSTVKSIDNLWNVTSILPSANNKCPNRQGNLSLTPFLTPFSIYYSCDFSMEKSCGLQLNELTIKTGITLRISNFAIVLPADSKFVEEGWIALGKYRCIGMIDSSFDLIITREVADNQTKTVGKNESTTFLPTTETTWADENNFTFSSTETSSTNDISTNSSQSTTSLYPPWPQRTTTSSSSGTKEPSTRSSQTSVSTTSSDSNSTQSTTFSSSPETSSGTDKHTTAEITLLPDRFNDGQTTTVSSITQSSIAETTGTSESTVQPSDSTSSSTMSSESSTTEEANETSSFLPEIKITQRKDGNFRSSHRTDEPKHGSWKPNRTGNPDKRTISPMDANTTTIPSSTSSLETTSSDGSSQGTTTSDETTTSSSDGTTSKSTATSNGSLTTSTAATSTIPEESTVGSTSSPSTTGFDETVTTDESTDLNITSTVTVTTDFTASSTYPSTISKESTARPNSTSSSSSSSITRPEEAVIIYGTTYFNITTGTDYTTGSTHPSTMSQESTVKSSTQGSSQSTSFEDFASRVSSKTTSSQSTTSDQQSTTVKSSTTYQSTLSADSSASTTEPTSSISTVATTSSSTQSIETDSTTFATTLNEGQGQTKQGHSSTEAGTTAEFTLHPDMGNTQNGSDGQTTSRTTSSTAETTGTSTIGQSSVSTSPSTGSTSGNSSTGSNTRIPSSSTGQDLSISPSSSSNPSTESTEISRTTADTYSTGTETKSTNVSSTSEKVIPSSNTVTSTTSTDFQNIATTVSTSASNPTSSFTSQSTDSIESTNGILTTQTEPTESKSSSSTVTTTTEKVTISSSSIGSATSTTSTDSQNVTTIASSTQMSSSSFTSQSTESIGSTSLTESKTTSVIKSTKEVFLSSSSGAPITFSFTTMRSMSDSQTSFSSNSSTEPTGSTNISSTSGTIGSIKLKSIVTIVPSSTTKISTNGTSSSTTATTSTDSTTSIVTETVRMTPSSLIATTEKVPSTGTTKDSTTTSDAVTSSGAKTSTTAGTSTKPSTSDVSNARSSTTTSSPSDSSSRTIETSSSSPTTTATKNSRTSSAGIWTMETTRESGTSKAAFTSTTSNVQTTSTKKILDQSTMEDRPLTTQIIRDSSSSSGTVGSTSQQTAESTPTSSSSNVGSSSKGSTEDSTSEATEPVIIDILNITEDSSSTGAHSSMRFGTIGSNAQTTSTTQSTSVISSSSTSTESSSTVSTAVSSTSSGTSENTVSTPIESTSSTGTDSRLRTSDTTRSSTESTAGARTTRKSTTTRSSSQTSTPTTTQQSTTTSPWRNCSKICPDGYFEGTSFCYYFVASSVYQAYFYPHAYSYCKRNITTSLVGPDDFQDDSNLKLFREMYNGTTLDAFWVNEYQSATMWATKSAKMISIFNSTEYHLDTWSVSITLMVQKSNAICKATKNCSPWTCKTSLIYDEIGYLLVERPADIPDEFPPGTDFLQNCLLTSSSAKITCQNNGEWTPHPSNLVRACKPADEPLPRQENPIPSNGPVRKSCTECYWQGTANCTETAGGYSCNCKPGWSDFTCYTALSICRKNSCLSQGTCKSFPVNDGDAFDFTCSCSKRWKGKRCQIQIANVTVFGSNTTVPIIFHGSVAAGITATGSLLSLFIKYLAALSWPFESAKDPIDVCQHMRDLFILLGSLSIAVYGRPSVMGITMFSGRVISLEIAFLFLMALFMYFMESIFVMDVCLGQNRNQWNVQSDGKRNWRYNKFGVIVLSIFYFLLTLSVAMIAEWNGIASNWTTLGLWEEETNWLGFYVGFNSTMLAIFCYLHSTRAGIAASSQGEKYRYMEIIHKEEFTPHPYLRGMNMDRVLKAKRSILGCRFVPLLLNCSVWYTSYCFFFYKGDFDFLCIALSLLVCVFTVVQRMITYSPTMEILLTGVLFRLRFLPDRFVDWLWSGPTPLTRLTRAEVHAAFDQKQILPYPAIPSVEDCSSYLTEEERYWIHRDLTRNYCQMRYDTGNSSEDCIRTLLKPEYTKAIQTIKCKQMKYWLGVWAQKIREEDTFTIQRLRDLPKSKSEEVRRARMAATMSEGQIAQEDKQCARYLEVAQALGEQKIIKMGMVFVRKDKNWLDFLINCINDYPKPHRSENSYQFVTRDQHSETLIHMEKWMKEKALSTDPNDQKAFEEALFDEKRPGFIGPHLAQDYRHLPGAREALEMFYATKQFHREMRKLADECIEYWREAEPEQSKKIKEEVEAEIEAKEQEERNKKEQKRANSPDAAEEEEDPNVAVYQM